MGLHPEKNPREFNWSRANRYLDGRYHPGRSAPAFHREKAETTTLKREETLTRTPFTTGAVARALRPSPRAARRKLRYFPARGALSEVDAPRTPRPPRPNPRVARAHANPTSDKARIVVRTDVEALVVRRVNSARRRTFPEANRGADMACCGTRSRVDGPEACTVCLEPLPLPGPGGDCVLVLHACGHAFHRDCAQDFLLDALRRRRTPRCPNCRATLHTAPFGKLLGQRKLPRSRRMKNMRQLITVSEVRRFFYPLFQPPPSALFFAPRRCPVTMPVVATSR